MSVSNFWIAAPTAAVYCGVGALASCAVFNKLSHIVEYTMNKRFGDYQNAKKTSDGHTVVSMPSDKDYYYTQNIVLANLTAFIASKAVKILALSSCPSLIATSLLVGSVAAPILFGLINILVRMHGGHHGRWVEIGQEELVKRGINQNNLEPIGWGVRAYTQFGSAPRYCPGNFDD